MKTLTFYGASDDLIEVEGEGVSGADEYNVAGDGMVVARFVVGGLMRVRALYDGCWSFAVGQIDEDFPLPDWPIRIRQSDRVVYSVLLEVDLPDDRAVVTREAE